MNEVLDDVLGADLDVGRSERFHHLDQIIISLNFSNYQSGIGNTISLGHVVSLKELSYYYGQGWGAQASRSRVFMAPWSRSRLKKKTVFIVKYTIISLVLYFYSVLPY